MKKIILSLLVYGYASMPFLFSMGKKVEVERWHLKEACTICWEDLTREACQTTACAHRFHAKCVQRWLEVQPVCPFCNNPLSRTQLTEIRVEKKIGFRQSEPELIDDASSSQSDECERDYLIGRRDKRRPCLRPFLSCLSSKSRK